MGTRGCRIATRSLVACFLLALAVAVPGLGVAADRAGQDAERRVALVVGNSAYRNTPPLPNPRHDAEAVGAELKRLGFDVDLAVDLDRNAMEQALRRFGDKLEGAQVALFYYAGHGLQFNGVNYLVPVDARLVKERDLNYEAVDLGKVLKEMDAERRVNLVFLDACRDNPLSRTLARSLGAKRSLVGRGLAPVDAAVGTLIAYATKDGDVAEDGAGEHSPYTQALLSQIGKPGLEVGLMLRRVREEVMRATGGKQQPWEYGSLVGEFYFLGPTTVQVTPQPTPGGVGAAVDPKALELSYWESIKGSQNPEMFRAYLAKYPQGTFAEIAKLRIQELETGARPQTTPGSEPAPVGQERHRLTVKTVPAKATVRLPDHPQPYQRGMQLPPGRYRVEVTHPGYAMRDEWVEIADRDVTVTLKLTKAEAPGKQAQPPALQPSPAGSPQLVPGALFRDQCRDSSLGPEMVVIPATSAKTSAFAMGRYEITVSEFRRFVTMTGLRSDAERSGVGCFTWTGTKVETSQFANWMWPGYPQGENHPAVCLSFNDAVEYVRWLSNESGHHYRLPTEKEWEHAARAGARGADYWGQDADGACRFANVFDASGRAALQAAFPQLEFFACTDGYAFTAPVGSLRPDAWGLYDMLGNVWEWTCSEKGDTGRGASRCSGAGPTEGKRAIAGAAWDARPGQVGFGSRTGAEPFRAFGHVGFRIARDLSP